ncbi:LPXTG cell wall anchor domain-containing protein [Sphingomonas sp. DT-51]|uniref:LPXTG cell wall anchor domain-containing protein n=1 Tax=Sphingomonas sp. DT-51 TaxID=3396165 RepID=UPI003F1ABDCF
MALHTEGREPRSAATLLLLGTLAALMLYVVKCRLAPATGPDNVLLFALIGGALGGVAALIRDWKEQR